MNYTQLYQRCFQNRLNDLSVIQHFLSRLKKKSIVVELGAGTGRIANQIPDRRLILIESSEEMAAALKSNLNPALRHEMLLREAFRLPLETNSVDGLFTTANTLGEMLPISFTLAEISRVLKVGGQFHFLNENPHDLIKRLPGYVAPVPNYPSDIYRLSTRPCDLFGKFGFETTFQYQGSHYFRTGIPQVLPDLAEFKKMLAIVDLKIVEHSGDLKGSIPASQQSQFLNIICEKISNRRSKIKFTGLNKFYDKMAADYDNVVEVGQYRVPETLMEWTLDTKTQTRAVLDLGCANGHLGRRLRANHFNWRFFGVDFSKSMVEQCELSESYDSVLQGDLNFGIPVVENECFDTVLGLGVSEFIKSPALFLSEINRVLHKGGQAILSFESTSPTSITKGVVQKNGVVRFHYTEKELVRLLESSGFSIDRLESLEGYLSPTLKRWIPYYLAKVTKK